MRGLRILAWLAGLVLLGLLALYFVVRERTAARAEEFDRLLARHASEGRGTTAADLIEEVDQATLAQHEASVAWVDRAWPEPQNASGVRPDAWLRFHLGAEPQPPPQGFEDHEAARAHAQALGALLDAGPLEARVAVHLAYRKQQEGRLPRADDLPWGAHVWSLLRAADWFAVEAMIGADRERAFRRLDRLHAASSRPTIVLECMVATVVASTRDAAYVRDALEHGAGQDHLDDWLAEPPAAFDMLAEGFRGDRILYAIPLARRVLAGDVPATALARLDDDLIATIDRELYVRWDGPRDAVRLIRLHARCEDWLRGRVDDAAVEEAAAWAEGAELLEVPFAMWRTLTNQWIGRRAEHRAARAAVEVLRLHADGDLPEDDAALRDALGPRRAAALLDGGPREALLRYERAGAEAIRVVVDPARALPAVLGGEDGDARGTRLGTPPYGLPLRLDMGGIDLHLPAR